MPRSDHLAAIQLPNVRGRKLRSKLFVVVLSQERNLFICRNSCTAGFPDTDNGQWAYLDIDEGDYVTMYFNGRLWDLYLVERKYIPAEYYERLAKGNALEDSVAVRSGERWTSIGNEPKIYFPYRLELTRLQETTFETSLVFREGLERLGINLVPRVSLKKTHFQLSHRDLIRFFHYGGEREDKRVSFASFLECTNRHFASQADGLTIPQGQISVADATRQECYLQAMLKKILEWSWNEVTQVLAFGPSTVEFLSEQTVHGGEADIVILSEGENYWELLIEVKNDRIINRGSLNRLGERAFNQVNNYLSLIRGDIGTQRGIAGKASRNDNALLIGRAEGIITLELDGAMPISYLSPIGQ